VYSPLLSSADRLALTTGNPAARAAVEEIAQGRHDWLNAFTQAPVFDSRKHGVSSRASADQLSAGHAAIAAARVKLLEHRFGGGAEQNGAPLWAPLFLGSAAPAVSDARNLLAPAGAVSSNDTLVHVTDPRDLSAEFVAVLSRWFQLQELGVRESASTVAVPEQTTAFAVSLKTRGPASFVELRSNATVVRLAGRDGVWAGVGAGGGSWSIHTDAGGIAGGRVFLRPRHAWTVYAPPRLVVTTGEERFPLELRLVRLAQPEPAIVPELPGRLPDVVHARVISTAGERIERLVRSRVTGGEGYRAELPAAGLAPGTIRVEIDLAPLSSAELPVASTRLEHTFSLESGLDVLVRTDDGRRTLPVLRGVPREAEAVRDAIDRRRKTGNRQ
jgi:hypothetical protein